METREILFGTGFFNITITGEKKLTLRKFSAKHLFKKGELALGIFEEGYNLPLEITRDTKVTPWFNLTDEIARQAGYKDAQTAFDEHKQYYPDLTRDDDMAIIYYRVPMIQGFKTITTNMHYED